MWAQGWGLEKDLEWVPASDWEMGQWSAPVMDLESAQALGRAWGQDWDLEWAQALGQA